jgi:MFS family permease
MSRRSFLALTVAETLAISGTRLSTIAIPWLVLTTTGSPVLTGIVAMVEMIPYVVARALAGPVIDRIGPSRVSVSCDAASVLVIGLVPVLHLLGMLTMPVLLPIVFVLGVLRGPSDAAKYAMIPDVAERAGLPLERVTGVVGMVERLASTIGAAGAGLLIGLLGPGLALAVNAVTFGLGALIVAIWLPRQRPAEGPAPAETKYLDQLGEGWTFLRQDAVLVSIVVMVGLTNLFDQAFAVVLLPVWVEAGGHGPAILGLVLAVFSGASILGAGIAAMTGERLPRLATYTVAFLITGFPRFLVFALDAPMVAIFVTMAAGGFASGFLNPILGAVIFERIPRALTGRVTSLYTAFCWALLPFGGLVGGAAISLLGLSGALISLGTAYLIATLLPLARREFRGFDTRRKAVADTPAPQ